MTDPRKRFDTHKTVRMTAAFAKAIEREAKRQRISEGEVARRWMEVGRNRELVLSRQIGEVL